MSLKFTVLPLDWEKILWTKKIQHQLKLTSIGMSRYTKILCNHLNSPTSLIDSIVYACDRCTKFRYRFPSRARSRRICSSAEQVTNTFIS